MAQSTTEALHFDESRAVEPLEREAGWKDAEAPETHASGV